MKSHIVERERERGSWGLWVGKKRLEMILYIRDDSKQTHSSKPEEEETSQLVELGKRGTRSEKERDECTATRSLRKLLPPPENKV